jgi:endonuclease YncB( thermonuclease family)
VSRVRPLWRTLIDALAFFALFVAVLLALQLSGMVDVAPGNVVVIDGDSLREGNTEIRLYGIDAPEYRQTCLDASKLEYPCGKRAAEALRNLVHGTEVKCQSMEKDRYGRSVSTCHAGTLVINREMVAQGWAVAFIQYGADYVLVEKQARQAKRGLWAGQFEEPALYRQHQRSVNSDVSELGPLPPD